MALARKVDRLVLKREKKMDVAESHVSILSVEGDIRTLMRSNKSRSVTKPSDDIVASNDAIAAGAASIADIEGLMAELQAARDYLRAEGERVRWVNANYAHLAQTASASARVIVESIGKWRIPEQASSCRPPSATGPNASADGETLAGPLEVQPVLEKTNDRTIQADALTVFPYVQHMTPESLLDGAHVSFLAAESPSAGADIAKYKSGSDRPADKGP
jgi:hypothetical protein